MILVYCRLQPPVHSGSSFADCSTLKMEAIRSSETSFNTISIRRYTQQDGILHSDRRDNLKSYMLFIAPQLWHSKVENEAICAPSMEYIFLAFLVETSHEQRIRMNLTS
jgi:hypothetical protein